MLQLTDKNQHQCEELTQVSRLYTFISILNLNLPDNSKRSVADGPVRLYIQLLLL